MVDTYIEADPARPRLLMLLAGFILVVVVGAGVALTYLMDRNKELVILKAETEPYKVRPSDPGGLKLNNLDSPVMGLLDPLKDRDTGREVLLPPVTEPELPPIAVAEPAEPTPAAEPATLAETAVKSLTEEDTSPAPAAPETEALAETVTQDLPPAEEAASSESTAEESAPESIDAAVDKVLLPEPRPKVTPKRPSSNPDDLPSFVVQFAAFTSEKNATNTAAVLATKHSSRLNGITIGYMRNGKYWRVVTDPMPRADANSMCSMFRSVGQDCIVKLMESP